MTMRLAGVLIGPAILAFLIVTGLSYVVPEPSSESQARAMGLVWGGRIFTSQGEFARWLAERGRSYQEWNRLHPGSPWATTRSTRPSSASAPRTLASSAEQGSNSVVVTALGAVLVFVIGLLAIGVAMLARTTVTAGGTVVPRARAPRPLERGAKSVAASRPSLASAGLAARRGLEAAWPRLETAGSTARRGVEAARPRLVEAGSAARERVEAARPRLVEAGSAARERVEAAAAETALVGWSLRYSFATRGAAFYAFAAVFSAALGVATALLLLLALGEV